MSVSFYNFQDGKMWSRENLERLSMERGQFWEQDQVQKKVVGEFGH